MLQDDTRNDFKEMRIVHEVFTVMVSLFISTITYIILWTPISYLHFISMFVNEASQQNIPKILSIISHTSDK